MLVAASSFAQDMQNRFLFIEGTAVRIDHLDFFQVNFVAEATGAGYIVTDRKSDAEHTLRFDVVFAGEPDVEEYAILISLYRNEDDARLIAFEFEFSTLIEINQYIRTLFLNATANIPITTEEVIIVQEFVVDNEWKNKWVYFRASFDYPITFYLLQPTGLKGGAGLFNNNSPPTVSPIGHEIMAMPGATVGAEFQLLNFLSLELNLQMSMGDTRNTTFVNLMGGVELKFPIKFQDIMLVPYGAFSLPLRKSPIFEEFPLFAAGAGIQVCARAGKSGAFFVDAKYMLSFTDAVMRNPYLDFELDKQLFPEPAVIHYKRSQIGIGIGYKIGIFDR